MSTQRYIDTSFWDDTWVQELDPSEKLLYIYLLTNPLTNIAGVMELTIKRICFDTGFNADTVTRILGKFEDARKVFKYNNYIIIRNFPKHQQIENDRILKGIASILSKLPNDVLCYLHEIDYQLDIPQTFDNLCIPYPHTTKDLEEDSSKEEPQIPVYIQEPYKSNKSDTQSCSQSSTSHRVRAFRSFLMQTVMQEKRSTHTSQRNTSHGTPAQSTSQWEWSRQGKRMRSTTSVTIS